MPFNSIYMDINIEQIGKEVVVTKQIYLPKNHTLIIKLLSNGWKLPEVAKKDIMYILMREYY